MSQVPTTEVVATIRAASEIAERRGRPDLVRRLAAAERIRGDATVKVVVVGDYKSGKSSLVNALVGEPACPIDDDLATAVITAIRYAPTTTATVSYQEEGAFQQGAAGVGAIRPPVTVPLEDLPGVVERGNHDGHPVAGVDVGAPSAFLAGGLELIDTPVLGGLDSPQAVATLMGLPYADALLFVSDTSQEYTAPEVDYLRHAWDSGTRVICVMAKIDLHPQWRRILDIDAGHLRNAGFEPPILPTSARLHELSVSVGDASYAIESGIPALREYLIRSVVAPAIAARDQTAVGDVVGVLDLLESVLRAEQAALAADVAGPSLADLRLSDERATDLLGDGARWRQILSDGVEDLSNDVQHQLQVRLRDLLHTAGDMVDVGDPVSQEQEFSNRVSRGAAAVVSDCFQVVAQRGQDLSGRVVEELSNATAGLLLSLDLALATEPTDQLSFASHAGETDDEDKVLMAIGGAWGGMEPLLGVAGMVGLGVGGVVAAPILLAVAGVAGVLTVGRAFKQERRKALGVERQKAKHEYREYIDEVQVRFTKALDDAVRSLYRQLRDGASTRVAEFQRTTRSALHAMERAPLSDDPEHEDELAVLRDELEAVASLRAQARGEVRATLEGSTLESSASTSTEVAVSG